MLLHKQFDRKSLHIITQCYYCCCTSTVPLSQRSTRTHATYKIHFHIYLYEANNMQFEWRPLGKLFASYTIHIQDHYIFLCVKLLLRRFKHILNARAQNITSAKNCKKLNFTFCLNFLLYFFLLFLLVNTIEHTKHIGVRIRIYYIHPYIVEKG